MQIRHAELFAGIGGFSLAAKWMGWKNEFQVEIDEWSRNKLRMNFKDTDIYGDIKDFKGSKYKGKIDVLSGGFPCQPFSVSGNRKGKNDDRYLWPEMLRICKEIRPRFIVVENVPGIISMELDQVLTDLENENYTCWPPFVIPACATGTDHKRERVWIIAHANGNGRKTFLQGNKGNSFKKTRTSDKCYSYITTAEQFEKRFAESILLHNTDGLPKTMDVMNALKAMGNAIVPQIAYTFFNQIETYLN